MPSGSLEDPSMVQAGARAFSERGCVNCHGAPGVNWAKFSEGLRPDPPDLKDLVNDRRPQDLFWVVRNGIHMTGMPSFGLVEVPDQEIWTIVAFLKKLPNVSEADFKAWSGKPRARAFRLKRSRRSRPASSRPLPCRRLLFRTTRAPAARRARVSRAQDRPRPRRRCGRSDGGRRRAQCSLSRRNALCCDRWVQGRAARSLAGRSSSAGRAPRAPARRGRSLRARRRALAAGAQPRPRCAQAPRQSRDWDAEKWADLATPRPRPPSL